METPNNLAGRLTEKIMAVFWGTKPIVDLSGLPAYNRVYSHVYNVLVKALGDQA